MLVPSSRVSYEPFTRLSWICPAQAAGDAKEIAVIFVYLLIYYRSPASSSFCVVFYSMISLAQRVETAK